MNKRNVHMVSLTQIPETSNQFISKNLDSMQDPVSKMPFVNDS